MSKDKETQISMKILVDKERNKVLYAEANYNFVDILFSFMTLPMGTIVRLIKKNSASKSIGCLTSLYESVANLPSEYFLTEEFKQVLLNPQNSSEAQCRKLKLNVDDTIPTKYFICQNWECSRDSAFFSNLNTTKCCCGRLLNREIGLSQLSVSDDHPNKGVFVTESATFMITDDLCVMPASPISSIQILCDHGIRDMKLLEKRTVTIGLQEVLNLLELTLVSRSALTDLFLCKRQSVQNHVNSELGNFTRPLNTEASSITYKKMAVKVYAQKSIQKPLFLLAEEDFADFLVSLITIPLGQVVGLLNSSTYAGSVDKLYQSISKLNVGRYLISKDFKDLLLHPKLGWNWVCKNQIFTLKARSAPSNHHMTFIGTNFFGGIVRGPAMFMVTDDLVIAPLSSISTLSLLDKLKVPFSDVEECEVSIGIDEALCILKASLVSSTALFSAINLSSKKPKQEP